MSDMVEKVARELSELGPRDTFHYNYDTHASEYREIARAAIKAMRDGPTPEMLEALGREADVSGYRHRGGPLVLKAIFEAALKEGN